MTANFWRLVMDEKMDQLVKLAQLATLRIGLEQRQVTDYREWVALGRKYEALGYTTNAHNCYRRAEYFKYNFNRGAALP